MVTNKKLRSFEIFLIFILCTLFYVAGVLIIYFTTIYKANNVPYQNCNAALGEFALEHGSGSNNVKNQCGPNLDQPCVSNAPNLKSAVNYCNSYSTICDRFSYNETTGVVSIVDLKGKIISNDNSSLFTRQVGITYNAINNQKDSTNTNSGNTNFLPNFNIFMPAVTTSSSPSTTTSSY